MLNPNSNLELISEQLKQMISMVDYMKAEQIKNIVRDNYLTDHERRITANEESIDYLLSKDKEREYYKDRNEELEFRQNPYSQDGDANCNS